MKLSNLIIEGVQRSVERQFAKVTDEVFEEVSHMFPTWWEAGPLQAATATIQRQLKEEATAEVTDALLLYVRISAEALALDYRSSTRVAAWATERFAKTPNLRDRVLAPLLSQDDEQTNALRKIIEQYGVNAKALWAHFAV